MNEPVIRRSKNTTDDWQTPNDLLAVVQAFGSWVGCKGITLDPATTKENPTRAAKIRTPECDPDGLKTDWSYAVGEEGLIYVNPPYKAAWYTKIGEEAERMRWGQHMIALLPGKPGTGYFQDLVGHSSAIVFIRGRLTFKGAPDPAPFESAMMYFGSKPHQFRAQFEKFGWAV
jgi:hypothetical protein